MKHIILIYLLSPLLLLGQGWERNLDDGIGFSVQQLTDGGYIITGYKVIDDYNYDVLLIKTDMNGDTIWSKTYGGYVRNEGRSVQQTTDQGFIICGYTYNTYYECKNFYLIKTDANGDTLWTKTYGGQYNSIGESVQQTLDGGYIMTGRIVLDNSEIYLIKTNSSGDTLWTKTYGGQYDDIGNSVQQTTDGGYIITGRTNKIISSSQICLVKTDQNGDTIWTKAFGGEYLDEGYSVQQTIDGGYIITGTNDINTGWVGLYLIKTDENGDELWSKIYDDRIGVSSLQTLDGGYIITGLIWSDSTGTDVMLSKTDDTGEIIWTKNYGGNEWDCGYSVQLTSDNGYIVAGVINQVFPDHGDVYLIKTDSDGIVSTIEIPTQNHMRKLIRTIDITGREISKPLKNIPYIEIYDDGTSQKKINLK